MRVPVSWLAEHVRLTEPISVVAERLTMAGLAVDAIEAVGVSDPAIRVGRLAAVERHPDADRLRVCRVELGEHGAATIVSGAPGLRRGQRVAVASPGARLADGSVVEARALRGVQSDGVLCSAAEIGIGQERDVVLAFGRGVAAGSVVADLPGVSDTVLELEVTPNRGDCLSIRGVAREVAAALGTRLRRQRVPLREKGASIDGVVAVRIEDVAGCPRYLARLVRDASVPSSPLWLRLRLERAGMRPINAIVDATNYVMLEHGQPLHAFDWDRVEGGGVHVRRAARGETITTLDDVARALEPQDLVIADAAGPVAIAGVMGGARTEVQAGTTTLLLESAFFDPASVRRTGRRLGLVSEAAYRFERRVDPEGVRSALDAAAALIAKLTGGVVAAGVASDEAGVEGLAPGVIRLRAGRAEAALGIDLSGREVRRRLTSIGAAVARDGRALIVTPPSHRGDLHGEEDLVEELARVGGYDAVPTTLPSVALKGATDTAARLLTRRLRGLLVAEGLSEAVTPAFTSTDTDDAVVGLVGAELSALDLQNPLSAEYARMRRTPLAGLVRAAKLNADRGVDFIGLFEIGKAYGMDGSGARVERRAIAIVLGGAWPARGAERRGPTVGFADLKGIVENVLSGAGVPQRGLSWQPGDPGPLWHPGHTAEVRVAGGRLGVVGAIHPGVAQALDIAAETLLAELDFQQVAHYRSPRSLRPLPRFPAVTRDIAVVVEEDFLAQAVLEEVQGLNHSLIESVRLFDCYRGDPIPVGKKSLAYTIAYRADDRTLTDDEVNAAHDDVRTRLTGRFTLDLRS